MFETVQTTKIIANIDKFSSNVFVKKSSHSTAE